MIVPLHRSLLEGYVPWIYHYDSPSGVFVATAWGVVRDTEILQGLLQLRADPKFTADSRRFGDYAHVDRFDLGSNFLKEYERVNQEHPAMGKYAILRYYPAGTTQFDRFLIGSSLGQRRVFIDRQEAVDWLNDGITPSQHLTLEATTQNRVHVRLENRS